MKNEPETKIENPWVVKEFLYKTLFEYPEYPTNAVENFLNQKSIEGWVAFDYMIVESKPGEGFLSKVTVFMSRDKVIEKPKDL